MSRPLRVMIADDDAGIADVLEEFVRECGHEPIAKITGGGLEVIRRYAQYQPDAVLLDIMMPRFNGLTVCHALLSRDPTAQIVFVSGKVDGAHPFVTGARAMGCLTKPINRDDLRDVLSRLQPQPATN